jgi:acyl carrier protein
VSEANKGYELEMLKMVINKHLDESTSFTKKNLDELETKRDQFVWDFATKIYQQSGHKVELNFVRDIVNSRIRTIKNQLTGEERRVAEQKAQERSAKEARHAAESEPQFLAQVADALGKFGGNEYKARIFVKVRKIISEQLSVEESEVSLDSHLSNHLNADELDLVELVLALEEEFGIEVPDEISEEFLDIRLFHGSGSSWWGSSSSPPSSYSYNTGEKCIVRNFVELIFKKTSD